MCLRIFCYIFSFIFLYFVSVMQGVPFHLSIRLCEFTTSSEFFKNITELKYFHIIPKDWVELKKQIDVFQYIKSKNFDICCLQDTHFTESQEIYIRNRCDGNCYFSPAF